MCEGFKKFLFPSPVSEDVGCCKDDVTECAVTSEAEFENVKNDEVKKCKHCGRRLKDIGKEFCNNYCESMYRLNEQFKKKYGTAKCVVCGEEFVKYSSTQETCGSFCDIKREQILGLERKIANEEENLALEDEADICSDMTTQEDILENMETEKNLSQEFEDDNYTVQCDCVPDNMQTEETQENLMKVPQDLVIKCAVCDKPIGELFDESNGEYCFCSEKCFKYYSRYGTLKNFGNARCSDCGTEFVKRYKNQKKCYDCGHKYKYW